MFHVFFVHTQHKLPFRKPPRLRLLLPLLRKYHKWLIIKKRVKHKCVIVTGGGIQFIRMLIKSKHVKNATYRYHKPICLVGFLCGKKSRKEMGINPVCPGDSTPPSVLQVLSVDLLVPLITACQPSR